MKQVTRFFAGFLFIFTSLSVFAQLPPYYNYNTNGTNNSFPFNIAGGKMVQSLFLPGDFNQPSGAPSGMITHLWFRVADAYPLAHTYTNLYIRMGRTNLTTLPTGAFYTGTMDTVFRRANHTITQAGGTWYQFILDTPFQYYNDSSLVIEIGQCSVSPGTGFSVCYTNVSGIRRTYNTTGCPYVYSGQGPAVYHFGITVAPPLTPPDYLYYKFENNPTSSSVLNCGAPGVGTTVGTMTGLTLTSGGQFDSCITGTGVTGSGVVTGWNNNLGSSSWTISFWADLPSTTFGYLFGDGGGSFRCFNNGAAGTGGITLRGTGITNVDVPGVNTGPLVIHFVYDSTSPSIKVYRNGVLSQTVAQTQLNLTAGTGFKVGGWTTAAGYTGKMDEFRLYRRKLDSTEIQATWNQDIPCGQLVSVGNQNNGLPKQYSLEQNYPNPFNPVTSIRFSLPKSSIVKLKIFDALGREVKVLVDKEVTAGIHEIKFDASELSSGIYFYTLETPGFKETKKMMLIK